MRRANDLGCSPDFQDIDPNDAIAVETQIGTKFTNWRRQSPEWLSLLIRCSTIIVDTGIISAAAANNLPTIYQWSEFADDGGLISYGPNLSLAYFLAGVYIGHIVKSATPANLTPLLLNNLEMVINLPTAKALANFGGIPVELLASADRIITEPGGHIP